MKKWALAVLALVQLAAAAAAMDVVTMVDTSASMFPYYDELEQYLLRDLLEHWLHKGDNFHLLSFADSPEMEIAERIGSPGELTAIIDRIYLLRPLGRYTDLLAALDYLLVFHEYVSPLEKINSLMRSVQRARAQSASKTS